MGSVLVWISPGFLLATYGPLDEFNNALCGQFLPRSIHFNPMCICRKVESYVVVGTTAYIVMNSGDYSDIFSCYEMTACL